MKAELYKVAEQGNILVACLNSMNIPYTSKAGLDIKSSLAVLNNHLHGDGNHILDNKYLGELIHVMSKIDQPMFEAAKKNAGTMFSGVSHDINGAIGSIPDKLSDFKSILIGACIANNKTVDIANVENTKSIGVSLKTLVKETLKRFGIDILSPENGIMKTTPKADLTRF